MPMDFAIHERIARLAEVRGAGTKNLAQAFQKGMVTPILLAGRNPVAGAVLTDVWGYPNIAAAQLVRPWPAAGYTLNVISDSASDTAAGVGARTLVVSYLDTSYNYKAAAFTLNGQTAVGTADNIATFTNGAWVWGAGGAVTNVLRQEGMEVLTAGTSMGNVGNIYACDSTNTYSGGVPVTTTLVYDCMLISDNIDASSQFTIPLGYWGMLIQFLPSFCDVTATPKFGKTRIGMTTGVNGIFRYFDLGQITSNNNGQVIEPMLIPIMPEKTDMKIMSYVSAASEVSVVNQLIIWPNTITG